MTMCRLCSAEHLRDQGGDCDADLCYACAQMLDQMPRCSEPDKLRKKIAQDVLRETRRLNMIHGKATK